MKAWGMRRDKKNERWAGGQQIFSSPTEKETTTSETIARILQPYNIRVAHKPITTLQQLLTNVRDKDEPNDRQGAVYKINAAAARPLTLVRPAAIYFFF